MASSQQHSLPPDVQENIIQNIQKRFSIYIERKMIRDVLNRECWDLEKSMQFLQKGLNTFNDNPSNARKKETKAKNSNQVKPHSQTYKPGTKNTTPGPSKAPGLIKNFKKKPRSKKTANVAGKDTIVPGNWVLLNDNNSRTTRSERSDARDAPTASNKESSVEQRAQSNENRLAKKKQMIQHFDLIKQFREPLDRITAYMKGDMKVMILLRGCSGSGKTTYANQILKKHGAKFIEAHIFSADNFFVNKEGNYIFNFDILPLAHEWNQKMVRLATSEGRSPIFVDNTNTRLWEMKEYASMAVEFGYIVETLEPPTPWFFHEDVLIRKTVHNVPRETIKKMLDRYEANVSGVDVMNGLKLKYGSVAPPQVVTAGLDVPTSKKYNKLYNQRLSTELSNKTSKKPCAKNSDPPAAPPRSKQTRQAEKIEVPLRPLMSRQMDNARFQPPKQQQYNQLPVNSNPMGFRRPPLLPGPNAGTNYSPSSGYVVPPMLNQQHPPMSYPQNNFYNQNNRPFMTAAVPNVFNQQFNLDYSPPMYHRPDIVYPLFNRPQEENLGNKQMTENMPSYVDDLIDLTLPTKAETSKENPIEMSSSISLLEGLRIESEKSDSEEEESSIEDSSDSESNDDGNETSTSYASSRINVAQASQEYVLVTDNEVIFQNSHEELAEIKTLEQFKLTTCSTLSNFPRNFEDFLLQYMNNSKSGESEDDVDVTNSIAPNVISNDIKKSKLIQEPIIGTEQSNINRPTTASGEWDYAKELPKEIPAANANKDRMVKLPDKIKRISTSTNTNYLDFEILRLINHGDSVEGAKVINGNPDFISQLCEVPCPPASVLMLNKGVMTSNVEASQPVVRDRVIGIERLSLMFPAVPKENLEELFDKCQKDINWTAGLLLDSGQEMSDLYSSTEPIECSSYDDDIQLAPGPSNDNGAVLKGEIKKQKKKKNNDNDISKYKEIQEKIQSNFVLGENHYSEKMKKHIERKHNIQIGSHCEFSPSAPPEDERDEAEEVENNDKPTEGCDFEEDAVFMLDSDFIFQLQTRFGGLLRPNMIAEKTVVSLPSNLARQLHSYIMDSILQQIEGEDIFTDDSRMSKDEELARQLQDEELKARGVPSLLEIMDEEVALKCQGQKDNNSGKSVANALSRQLLIERFPLMDPATLTMILEDTNHSLHEATSLLSSAGHFQAEPPKQQIEQNDTQESAQASLSREEAIKQADAYGDVASKLYELRKDCLKKSQEAYRDGNSSVALYYSDMARWYMERIEKSNSLAAKAILSGYEGWTTLDLHFLQVSEALNILDLFVDEVIRGLQDSKEKKAVVYVITGRGLHSAGGRPRLKPAVQSRLTKRDIRFTEQNPGMLKIIISRTALTSYNRELASACA